jgi:Outer membrane protein beta-barrel family/Carboxypeptidase regulatory-like domain/TonB-dependent Receptor Plug Domain
MRNRAAVLLLSLFCAEAPAQEEASVSGRVVDGRTRQPLAFVTVTLTTDPDGDAVTGALTDEDGRFVVAGLAQGRYTVGTSFVGYRPSETPLLVGTLNDVFDLGDITLEPSADALEEVVATARQEILEATLDRRIFSLDDTFAQATGSLLDAMRGLPGVTVDQEGKVLLRGSDRVAILIDGKQSGLTGYGNQSGLDSIPAGNIESIEIINNPSARYDAAGMAGIINIVFKQDGSEGLNVDVGLTLGVGQLSKRKSDLPTELGSFSRNPRLNPSLNLTHNGREGSYFLQSEVLVQDHLPNNEFTTRTYDDSSVVLSQVPENREQTHYILNGGFDRLLGDKRTFSLSSIVDFETHKDVAQVPFIDAETMQRLRYWFWEENEDTGFFNLALDYEREFAEPGHTLEVNLQYTRGWEDEAYYLNEESSVRVGTDATHLVAKEHTLPLQVDYTKPLASGRFEAGARLQKRWLPVTYDVDRGNGSVIYPGLGDWSEWGEDIYAGYVNYIHEKERYDVEAGIRIEQTNVYYDLPEENVYYSASDAYDYFKVYPNVRLTYHVDDANGIAMHYNNRVDRPGEPELRIFPKYDDPELLKVGNPYLRPQFTESFELAYERLWERGSAIASLYHRIIDDPFTRVYAIDDSNPDYDIINKIYQNVGSGTNTGLELTFLQDIALNWQLSGSLNWYDNVIDAADTTLLFPYQRPFSIPETRDRTWDLKLNSLYESPRGLRVQLSVVYYAEKNIAQGRQAARASVDLGISKPVFAGKGELTFSLTDLFNSFGIKQFIRGDGFDAIYENYYQTQTASMGLSYQF